MNDFSVWILTFARPIALNRLIITLGKQGVRSNVMSNSPLCEVSPEAAQYIDRGIINTLNDRNSNAWCARSWNSIYLKGFEKDDEIICLQDDTMIGPNFVSWLKEQSKIFEFISGPAGDQFFYIKKSVFQKVGWWDERFAGACYCADADYYKRVALEYDPARVSIQDTHNWGWTHNPCGVMENVITTYESKTVDPNYDNQHWALERMLTAANPVLKYNQEWYRRKWGVDLDNGQPAVYNGLTKLEKEVNWYPAHTKLLGVTTYD